MKPLGQVITSSIVSLGIALSVIPTANAIPNAEENTVEQYSNHDSFSEQELSDAYDELLSSDLPRRSEETEGGVITVFTLPSGGELAIPDINSSQPRVSGGGSGLKGFWVEFTPREQDLILSGSGFALGAAICAIPGVGTAACVVSGAIITGATWAISSYGKCDHRLRVEFSWTGKVRSAKCT